MKWEYIVSFITSFKYKNGELENHLNEMGKKGWQLIAVDNGMVYFRRLIETEDNFRKVIEEAAREFANELELG